MRYRLLGRSGLRVSELCLGTMIKDFAPIGDRVETIVATVKAVAGEVGRSPAQVALAWLRQRPEPVIPIVGARRLEQLRDNLA
jgi:aryl-alcohol dehydrogenase-like predicted oxidoreductase